MAFVRKKKKKVTERIVDIVIALILVIVIICTVYPLWHVVMYSFSSSKAVMSGGVLLWPRQFTTITYQALFKTTRFFIAFGNSFVRLIVGTLSSLIVTILTAYGLSVPELKGKRVIQFLFYFTMLFGGGLVPTYMVIKSLHLLDTFWVYIFPALLAPYNMFVMRNFFAGIPRSLSESAMLDGANHGQILTRIVLPLSKASIVTVSLFYIKAHWNSYMDGLIYVNSSKLELLQIYIRRLISASGSLGALSEAGDLSGMKGVTEESIKMSVISLSLVPIVLIYLFMQKHFVKGVTVGAVKG